MILLRILIVIIIAHALPCSASHGSDDEIFSFRGLDLNFVKAGCPELSPLIGIENRILAGYRLHGHLRKVKKNQPPLFEQPRAHSNCRGFDYEPTDFTSALIERLAPSCAGYVINDSRADPINEHKWLSPRNVAKILTLSKSPGFFEQREKAFEDLTIILLPEVLRKEALRGKLACEGAANSNRGKKRAEKLKNYTGKEWWIKQQPKRTISKAERKFREEKSNDFVNLLYGAFLENHGDQSRVSGYPSHMVAQILLSFLWEKHHNMEAAFRPYVEELVSLGIIPNPVQWNRSKAKYEHEDYYAAKKYLASVGKPSRQDLETKILKLGFWNKTEVTLREYETLRRLGFAYFEDHQPPVAGYGTCYREIDGQLEGESDCGESLVWDTFMHILYSPKFRRFEWEKLVTWSSEGQWDPYVTPVKFAVNEGLITFFRDICPTPRHIKDPRVRNAWGQLLSGLTKKSDPHPIRYLKPEDNPTYGIGPGVYNVLSVIGHLLGIPNWWKNGPRDLLTYQLEYLSEIASRGHRNKTVLGDIFGGQVCWQLTYQLESFHGKYIVPADPMLMRIFRKPILNEAGLADNLITVIFKRKEIVTGRWGGIKSWTEAPMFEWRCQPAHFDFIKRGIVNPDQINLENVPSIPDVSALCGLVYSQNLMTFEGRILAITIILTYLKQTNNLHMKIIDSDEARQFKLLLKRWLEPTGEFFAKWTDPHTTNKVYEIVSAFWAVDEICTQKLTMFFPELLRARLNARDVDDIRKILIADFTCRAEFLKEEQKEYDGQIISYGLLSCLRGAELLKGSPDPEREALHLLRLADAEEYLRGFTTNALKDLFPELDPDITPYVSTFNF